MAHFSVGMCPNGQSNEAELSSITDSFDASLINLWSKDDDHNYSSLNQSSKTYVNISVRFGRNYLAGLFRSAPAFLNLFMGTMKVISEFYPSRLHKAFIIDPPSMFSCLWKGARPFVDLWAVTLLVTSLDYDNALEDESFSCPNRTMSLRFDPSSIKSNGQGGSTSSRFAFTVSHLDSLKPWYLSSVVPTTTASPSLVGVSPVNARSFSFASPSARTPMPPNKTPRQQPPRTPRPSFLQSPSVLLSSFYNKKHGNGSRTTEKCKESFVMYLRFYRRPYDEMVYRAKMRPPLGGLASIVSKTPHGKQKNLQHYQRI